MKINMTKSAVALLALTALGACGGGSAGVGAGVGANADFGATFSSFAEMEARGEILGDRYEDSDLTPVNDMPTSGSATYTGLAAFGVGNAFEFDDDDATVGAEARISANFGRGVVSGELTNFQANDGTAISGHADITDGVIVDNVFAADVAGNISSAVQSGRLEGDLMGGFLGADAQAAGGIFEVDLIEGNGASTTYGGAMIVEKN